MGAKRNLTNDDRAAVLQQLLARLLDHKHLPRGAFVDVAAHFGVDRSTLSNATRPCNSVASRKKGHCGRNLKHNDVAARLQQVPKARRTTFRSIAAAMDMPRSTLHEYDRRGIFVKYTSHIKPQLSDANKAVRVKWSMDFVHSVSTTDFVFDSMMDYVHVDEKWFFATRVNKTYYLAPNEEPPHRTCKSKRFITKVMFLSAFDGKIGTWHFTEQVPAIRASRNRPAGTLETKPVSVTRDVYRAMLIDHVIPAIKAVGLWANRGVLSSSKTMPGRMFLHLTAGLLTPAQVTDG
ncbi:hypothetical protein AaE_000791 [Aphanomyces astaci]|uniref:Transposase Tc1-like domain-containing protein n=1 Tax=Aphanomyces astaci TaxID=112090 RepID=A0A6A5AYA9_APHAT|nr:hypothetical protein AaE_000791 [Aphanomyces astaci]